MSKTTPEKAFEVLKKNLDIWQMKDLILLLDDYIERKVQQDMANEL